MMLGYPVLAYSCGIPTVAHSDFSSAHYLPPSIHIHLFNLVRMRYKFPHGKAHIQF